jgi:hypothetical protein
MTGTECKDRSYFTKREGVLNKHTQKMTLDLTLRSEVAL